MPMAPFATCCVFGNKFSLTQPIGAVLPFFLNINLQMPSYLNVVRILAFKHVIACAFLILFAGLCLATTPLPSSKHGLGLLTNGQVAGWGNNEFGQVQAGQGAFLTAPVRLNLPGLKFASVASGSRHSLAVDETGKVWAWGDNSSGQLGLGHTRPTASPTAVTGLPGRAVQVVAGEQHSAALMAGGETWVWGANQQGQTGNGTIDAFAVFAKPVRLSGLGRVLGLASGDNFMLALAEDVTQNAVGKRDKGAITRVIWAWGAGQARPGMVDVIKNAESIRAGGDVGMARTATGGYWRWRANQAPVFAQRQAFDSLGIMPRPVLAALDTQTKPETQPKLAATVTAKDVANNNPASAATGAAQQMTPPAAPATVVAATAVAVPQTALPPATVVMPQTAPIVAALAAEASAVAVVVTSAKVNLSGSVRLSSVFGGDGSRTTGAAMENVRVSAEGAQCSATDSQGRYSCVAPAGWSGRVSLQRNNYRFTPSSLSFQNLRADAGGQDFAAVYDPR